MELQPSPFDDIPDELVHQPEMLVQTRLVLDQLTHSAQDTARRVLRDAAVRATAHSSMQVLESEAKSALRQLLDDPDEVEKSLSEEDDAQSREFRSALEQAIAADLQPAIDELEDEWLEMTSADLARAVATFWWNLGHDESSRYQAAGRLLERRDAFLLDGLKELTKRFELNSAEQLRVLGAVQQQVRQIANAAA